MQPASHRDCHTRTDPEHSRRTTSTATNRAPYTCPVVNVDLVQHGWSTQRAVQLQHHHDLTRNGLPVLL